MREAKVVFVMTCRKWDWKKRAAINVEIIFANCVRGPTAHKTQIKMIDKERKKTWHQTISRKMPHRVEQKVHSKK